MDVKEAVRTAKHWIIDVMQDENPADLGLEEVEYNDAQQLWKITLGFSRPWNSNRGLVASLATDRPPPRRAYRTILVDDRDGAVKGMQRKSNSED